MSSMAILQFSVLHWQFGYNRMDVDNQGVSQDINASFAIPAVVRTEQLEPTRVFTTNCIHGSPTNVDPVKDSFDLDKTQSSGDDLSDIDNVCNPLPSNTSYDLDETQSIETDSNDIEIGDMNPLPIMKPPQTTPSRDEAQSSDKDSSNVERQQYMMPYY
uniref:Ovule protein n=1 Tax=Panagrellus redivivus TaxID=6233 RepID=A0A7E4VFF5_PANRE